MNKIYVAHYSMGYDYGDLNVFTSLDKAKKSADASLETYNFVDVYEYTLINDEYVESKEPVYEAER